MPPQGVQIEHGQKRGGEEGKIICIACPAIMKSGLSFGEGEERQWIGSSGGLCGCGGEELFEDAKSV